MKITRLACFGLAALLLPPGAASAGDLLPDLIVNPDTLQDHEFVTDIIPGRLHIRLSNSTPNIGEGPMIIQAGEILDGEQIVLQEIFDDFGGSRTRPAGVFVFHPSHNHFHINNWAQYHIREVLPGDGVGDILYSGYKTSFCLLDSRVYTGPEPIAGVPPGSPQFFTCSDDRQGISVGYEDLYDKSLPDQWIDVTGLQPGEYWLESVVDPKDQILELDETNNTDRIKLVIAPGDLPTPDEIPLNPRLPWALAAVLVLTGGGILARRAATRGTIRQ